MGSRTDAATRSHQRVPLPRAEILLEMSKRRTELADLTDQYEAIVRRKEGDAGRY
jgi:hypothetical protein